MADFFRKIRKDGAAFMRDRVAPRVQEQIAAVQQRAAASKKDGETPQSSARLKNSRQAAWPEPASTSSTPPQSTKQSADERPKQDVEKPTQQNTDKPGKQGGDKKAENKTASAKATSARTASSPSSAPAQDKVSQASGTSHSDATSSPIRLTNRTPAAPQAPKPAARKVLPQSDKTKGSKPQPQQPQQPKTTGAKPAPKTEAQTVTTSQKSVKPRQPKKPQIQAATHMERIRAQREARLKAAQKTGASRARRPLPEKLAPGQYQPTSGKTAVQPSSVEATQQQNRAKAPQKPRKPEQPQIPETKPQAAKGQAKRLKLPAAQAPAPAPKRAPAAKKAEPEKPAKPSKPSGPAKQSGPAKAPQTTKTPPVAKRTEPAKPSQPAKQTESAKRDFVDTKQRPAAKKPETSRPSVADAPTAVLKPVPEKTEKAPLKEGPVAPRKATAAGASAAAAAAETARATGKRPSTPPRKRPVAKEAVVASEKKTPKNLHATSFRDRANANQRSSDATTKSPTNLKRRHIPGLDGVRGIAVIAVLLYHFWPTLFPGGFMGVDMFFVLSGYLITFLLVREYRKTGRISLKQFWLRRARRILPAAIVVIAICTALVSLFRGDIAVKVGYHALTSALFVSNWGQIAESGSYFTDNGLNIFTHYWSLSIEEQFYLVWPLLVMGTLALGMRSRTVGRITGRAGAAQPASKSASATAPADDKHEQITLLLYATIAIGLVSFITMLVLYNPDEDPTRVYFGTDTHAFGLAVGAAIAFMVSRGSSFLTPRRSAATDSPHAEKRLNPTLEAGAWIGFAGLVAMLLTVQDTASFTYRGGLLIASLLTGWLVALSVRGQGSLVRVLSHPSLAWFGDRSFSLYLWHWPLFLMSKQFFTETLDMRGDVATRVIIPFTALFATLACTYITYHYIENPFRKKGYRKTMMTLKGPRLAASTATASLVVVGIVVALATAPTQTNVEKQLQALAAQQKKVSSDKTGKATGAAADPNASPIKSHHMPRGRAITAVGDSVMLASVDALRKRFPGVAVDADVSRHYIGGIPILQNLKAQKKLRNTVVLGFGTNGQAYPGQLDQIMDMLGPDRTVILVAPYGPVPGVSDAAQQVVDFAATRPNVYPAMWCQIAASHQNALYSDGVHPKPESAGLYVRAITDALKLAASGKPEPRMSCPPM